MASDPDADEALARRLQLEEDDAARAMGLGRARARANAARAASDEALARRLQAEEVARARIDSTPFAVDDARDGATPRRGRTDAMSFVDGFVRAAMGGMGGAGRGDDAGGRATTTFEFPIGHGRSVRFETDVFGERGDEVAGAMDAARARFEDVFGLTWGRGTRGTPDVVRVPSIIDMLNAMQGVTWEGFGGGSGLNEDQRAVVSVEPYERAPEEAENATCAVCLTQVEDGENVKRLGCKHVYHPECIDRWLERSRLCPVCKRDVLTGESEH